MSDSQFEYPVELKNNHKALDTPDYQGRDRFECPTGAYMHTGAWSTWSYCPFCGADL